MVMDIHAHMASTEVIGMLAGTWDEKERLLIIHYACPCRAMPPNDSSDTSANVSVELDCVSGVAVSEWAARYHLTTVGWCVPRVYVCRSTVYDDLQQVSLASAVQALAIA